MRYRLSWEERVTEGLQLPAFTHACRSFRFKGDAYRLGETAGWADG